MGTKSERDYVLKTAPESLNSILHVIAMKLVNGKLHLPKVQQTKPKIDGVIRFDNATVDKRKSMLRPRRNGQHGAGFMSFFAPVLARVAEP